MVATAWLVPQVKEREAAKALERQREQELARMVLDCAAGEQAKEEEKQRRREEGKLKFRAEIEAQMKDNAHRR